jgi:alpha-N-acetylglucosamine transferase
MKRALANLIIAQSKIDRLTQDGATVVTGEKLALEWAGTRMAWKDVLTKLRLYEMVQYDKVIFFDSDTVITRPVDGIFDDPASRIQKNLGNSSETMSPADEGEQPTEYVWAGTTGQGTFDHGYPPRKGWSANSGIMVYKPSIAMFNYYMRLAKIKDRFNGRYPEQSLWNYAHRRNGNMPWMQLDPNWNVNWATWKDYEHGIASLHTKFWELDYDKDLRDFALSVRWKMEGYWMGKDEKSET